MEHNLSKKIQLKKIKDLKEELKEQLKDTYCDNIVDYNNGYIGDIISEIADNNVDIYTYNLLEWLKDNYSIVEEANEELGTPNGIIEQCQQGQYYQNEQELYNNLKEMILLYTYDYLYNNKIALNDEQLEELEEQLQDFDNNNTMEEIIDLIEEIGAAENEEEE